MAQDALSDRAQLGNRGLRARVAQVGAELHPVHPQRLEGVREQEQLALRVDDRAPHRRDVPRRADLHAPVLRHRIEVAGAADQCLIGQPADGERQLLRGGQAGAGVVEPALEPRAARVHQRVRPDPLIVRGGAQAVAVLLVERFEPDVTAFKDDVLHGENTCE